MSEYRERLQKMMLRAGRDAPRRVRYQRFYNVCEVCGYTVLVAGYLLTIAAHI
ncbi:MAG: hypothetical protein J6T51_06495 [Kiritimatiellae bacterium]|nr:hypothetical protein [Kiritimatiellia bacterium]